jgi:hypothetical protein
MNWYDDMPELGEVPPLTADDLHRIALRQTYSLAYWLDRDDEVRTDALIEEAVQLDLAALEDWCNSRDAADPFCNVVEE